MKHKKRRAGSRMLSMVLAMVLMVSGSTVPVQADTLPAEAESIAYEQPAADAQSTEPSREPENQESEKQELENQEPEEAVQPEESQTEQTPETEPVPEEVQTTEDQTEIPAVLSQETAQAAALPENTDSVIWIASAEDFSSIDCSNADAYYVLENDIEMEEGYVPAETANFAGVLDGRGHKIVFGGSEESLLFQTVESGAVLQNIRFVCRDGNMSASLKGSLVNCALEENGGFAQVLDGGMISNCLSLSGKSAVGSYSAGTLQNTYQKAGTDSVIPQDAQLSSAEKSEEELASPDFVFLLNQNKGDNGLEWTNGEQGFPALTVENLPTAAPAESEETAGSQEAAEEKPYVYFQYDDGRKQEMDENNTFTLNAMDEGTFVLAGTHKRADWNVSEKLYTSDTEYTTHYWVNASGRYHPADIRVVEGYVCNADNKGEVFQKFKINNVSSNVEEVKVFVGDQEVSLDKPYEMHGTDSGVAYLKARVKGSDVFKKLPVAAMYHENISGPGIIQNHAQGSKFTMKSEGEAVFKLGMIEDKEHLSKEFKVISKNVALESFHVTVPSVWYIDSWNSLGGYYVGITRGNAPDNYNCSFTPYNATNQNLVWEAKTPEIAGFMEAFGNGIVPKKAGVAKFHIYSQENKEISQDVSVEFKYKCPLQKAETEKDTYELEEGSSTSLQITPTPSNASEQRFNWSYSKEGIVEVTDEVQTVVGNVNAPRKTVHTIKAKKAGEVQVTGTPWDATADCKPVQFTVLVSKGGVVPDDTDYTALVKGNIQHGVDYLQKEPVNAYGDEWNIFTTLRAGGTISQENLDAYYTSVSDKLKTGRTKLRATDVARVSITLAAMGKDLTDIDGVNLMKALYNDELKTKIGKDTSNAPIWALIALDCQNAEIPKDAVWTREKLIQHILTFQTKEGGFGLTNNKFSSIDMTGMALQALAPYRNNDSYPEVKTAFDKALEHMKENMTENAGFVDSGKENSCTTAQVLTALTAAGIDPLDKINGFTKTGNKNIVKNLDSYKAESGFMWQQGQSGNGMATQQVTYAMEAYRRFAENENHLYDLTDVVDKDTAAANAVVKQIDVIGEVTLESETAIKAARKAYNALTDEQKKLVRQDVFKILEKAEEDLKKLEEEAGKGHVVVSVERFTIGQGYIHEPVIVPFEKGDNAVSILKKVIGAENWVGEDGSAAYLEAIKGADLGSDHVKVPDYISEKLGGPTTEKALENGKSQEGDALGEFDYSFMSGWMYHVNGVEVGYGMASYVPKDGDVLRYQFTLWGYGTDLTGYEYGNPDPVLDICNKDEITRVMAEVNEDRDMLMAVPAVKTAYDKAVELVSAVITPKAEIDTATENLRKAMEEAKEQMGQDKLAAESVIAKINVIGEVTLESEAAITKTRTAYDKLTDTQKKLVGTENLAKLTDAEKRLAELKEQATADQEKDSAVIEKINGIGEVTLESEKVITEARTAYDALTDSQKNLVGKEILAKLTAAEQKLADLKEQAENQKKDQAAADAVAGKIDAIGEKITLESKEAIEAARKAYDALTDSQKKLVSKETLEKLEKAEEELKKLEDNNQNPNPDPGKPEGVKMLVNEKYGVKLEGEGLTSDMELAVTPIGKDNADVEKMRKEIASDKSVFRLYNIKLTKNGKEIELPSECVLSIPVGKDYNGKELTVLHCSHSKVEKLTGKVTDEAVLVKVKSLDSFGVVIDTPASNGNNGSGKSGSNGNNGGNGSGNSGSGTLKGTGAKTGDEAPISVLLLMLAVSVAAFGIAAYKKNRQKMK